MFPHSNVHFFLKIQIGQNLSRYKRLRLAFEIWVDSWRITSDLSMQLEHIHQFSNEYMGWKFMCGGKPQVVEFWYKGWSLEAVLDKLPTAEVLETDKEKQRYWIRAKTFGKGIDMWLRSQGGFIEVISKSR